MNMFENISLRELNSFGVEARAARLVEWETAGELAGVFAGGLAATGSGLAGGRWMALGGGNNILFTQDYPGTLLRSAAREIEITGETDEKIFVRAEAGADWDGFTEWCVARGLWGAENLSGIPGTVGAAPIQNIGAYGAEAREIVTSVECFGVATRNTLALTAGHCGFGYRDSVFKRELRGKAVITAVNFALHKEPQPNLKYAALAEKVSATGSGEPALENIRRAVIAIRDGKLPDPRVTGNAGSFFKNPVVPTALAHKIAAGHPGMPLYPAAEPEHTKLAAGWLIEQAGWKGRTNATGRVGIHPKQALIVVNLGGATGREIADFAHKVRQGVKARFGVTLETEVNII